MSTPPEQENTSRELPPGLVLVQVRTTSLEMLRYEVPDPPLAPPGCRVERWRDPDLDEYRRLFTAVGGPWGWTGRLLMTDEELRAALADSRLEVWRLWSESSESSGFESSGFESSRSEVAGFIELDRRVPGEVEIAYFGLTPGFIGRGLGAYLLRWAIHHAWTTEPEPEPATTQGVTATQPMRRMWLHTCDYDHPGALAVYQKAGFRIFDEHRSLEAYPADHIERQ